MIEQPKIITPTAFQEKVMDIPEHLNVLLDGGRGSGKALCANTPIPTPEGWTRLGDVAVGDKVFDEKGIACSVLQVFDIEPTEAYRLHFSDETYLDACADHQWVTWTHAQRKHYLRHDKSPTKGLPEDWANAECRTTRQIVATLTHSKRKDANHCIPLTKPLQLVDAELPIDPYLLGIWLGDGTSRNGDITTMDAEIVEAFIMQGFIPSAKATKGRAATYAMGKSWNQKLRDMSLLHPNLKKVPVGYLRSSQVQRQALLQGLMDSDGYAANHNNCVTFDNTNKALVDAAAELARSLGEKPTIKEHRAMLYGKDCGPTWSVSWRPKLACFRLSRKLQRIQMAGGLTQQSRNVHRMIVKAEKIEPKPMRCLMVDSPNHMYLAGEGMIPTHNSVSAQFLMIRHAEKYKGRAKILYVRESWESIKQFEDDIGALIYKIFGDTVHHHSTNHTFTWPHGATIQISQLEDEKDYNKFQGKDFTMVVVDEYGARREVKWIWLLVSNMRAPKGIPTQVILLANPGGQQHGHIHYDFIVKAPSWVPFEKDGEQWVHCASTWRDNPMIDQEAYLRKLKQACGNDEDLFKAWDTGDWNIARGAYFAGALDERVHMLPIAVDEPPNTKYISSLCPFPITSAWQPYIAMDWGSGAPSVVYIFAVSPGVRGFPKGSLILVDELATHEANDLNVGLNWPPNKLADAIKRDLCGPWNVFPAGVGDDAYGLDDSLLSTLRKLGIYLRRPDKERVAGWQLMREMLVAAKERNGNPGLWISARCQYFWKTVPFLQRDQKRPEDIVTKNVPDHGADSCFIPGTKILASLNPYVACTQIEIERLRAGDYVHTRDGRKQIVATGTRLAETYMLPLPDGRIFGTAHHPFWVCRDAGMSGWCMLKNLQVGDLLLAPDGTHVRVFELPTAIPKQTVVYNIEVADCPEYFANGVLVHNCRYGILHQGRTVHSGATEGI